MPMHNLIQYSTNYSDTSESLWHFKRDEVPHNNTDLTINSSQLFKYKAALAGKKQRIIIMEKFCRRQKNGCSIKVFE